MEAKSRQELYEVLGKGVLVMKPANILQEKLGGSLDLSRVDIHTEEFEGSTLTTVCTSEKIAKIKLPINEYPLMEVDISLFDTVREKQYISYETDLDAEAFKEVLTITSVVIQKFISGDYKVKQSRSLFGKRYYVAINIGGGDYTLSEK